MSDEDVAAYAQEVHNLHDKCNLLHDALARLQVRVNEECKHAYAVPAATLKRALASNTTDDWDAHQQAVLEFLHVRDTYEDALRPFEEAVQALDRKLGAKILGALHLPEVAAAWEKTGLALPGDVERSG
jgi:hypothetical protein